MSASATAKFKHFEANEDIFINNLQHLMRDKGINEAGLSRKTGIPQPTLHKILSGRTGDPRVSTLKILAEYFCITIDSLYSREIFYHNRPVPQGKFIPILSWKTCIDATNFKVKPDASTELYWTHEDDVEGVFALVSKPSMEPRFARGTTLIIKHQAQAKDGDFVIVHYPNTDEATIRQFHVDGPDRQLLPINYSGSALGRGDAIDETKKILGTLIQSRFDYEVIHRNI